MNQRAVNLLRSMCGRKKPESENSLNSDSGSSSETTNTIGSSSNSWPSTEELKNAQVTYSFGIMAPFDRLVPIMQNLQVWFDPAWFIMVRLALESHGALGPRLRWKRILKIRALSSGVDTELRNMLSLMNFEEESISAMYSDGWIDIRSQWKSKGQANH